MLKVKICGITNAEDALAAEDFGADALGFIFYKDSKRFIVPEKAKEITRQLSPFTIKVGVFVNEKPAVINEISKQVNLNIIQLHGEENDEIMSSLNLPVIKAWRVNDTFRFEQLNNTKADYILLDTFSESHHGGTGKPFDWKLIPGNMRKKIILAGGISAMNIMEVISLVNPAAVDLSSSVESSPGIKDHKLLKEFFQTLNRIRRN